MTPCVLQVSGLRVTFFTSRGDIPAVNDVSFDIKSSEVVGLVGESGCGKTVTALSILRLVAQPARIMAGEIWFDGLDLLQVPETEMRSVRGRKIAMIFQEPMTALNPVQRIGEQVAEPLIVHGQMSRKQAREAAKDLLEAVKIPDPSKRFFDYPHQLSGGMRQRVMIAMAIACKPKLLIADEPTTALDVTIQSQILQLLDSLRREFQLSILLVTHALGVVAEIADRVLVMYAGRIVEQAPAGKLFQRPAHPYTAALLQSIPKICTDRVHTRLQTIEGAVPDLAHLPPGCAFYERCCDRMNVCANTVPAQSAIDDGHVVSCHKFAQTIS